MRKRRRRAATDVNVHSSLEELVVRGTNLLRQHNFKEAIPCFKQLMKVDGHAWQDDLNLAYLGRARELAEKAMYKEAIILWNNANTLTSESLPLGHVVAWMFNANQQDRGTVLFIEHEQHIRAQTPVLWETIGELIAAQILTSTPTSHMRQKIPDESPWSSLHDMANKALLAYVAGKPEVADQALRKIPLRSVFRSFRFILKALLLCSTDAEKAHRLLEKVSETSPFAGLADVVRCCTLQGAALVKKMVDLRPRHKRLVAILRGVQKEHLNVITLLHDREKKHALFPNLIVHDDLFPVHEVRACCQQLLFENRLYIKQFEQKFGPLPPWQNARIEALIAEKETRFHRACQHWEACIERLQSEPDNHNDNSLKIALIHRHVAEMGRRGETLSPQDVVSHLEKSLAYDPDDRQTWIQIIEIYQGNRHAKQYYQWVDKGVKKFPNDSTMLTVAMNAAFDKKTFIKAARLGMRVLGIDPINTGVRHRLIHAHLSHAWKKYDEGRSSLAVKEMAKARILEKAELGERWSHIHQGLLSLRMNEDEKGLAQIRDVLDSAQPGIVLPWHVLLEGGRRKIADTHVQLLRNGLSCYNQKLPVSDHVIEAITIIDQYVELDTGKVEPTELFTLLPVYFKKAAQLAYDQEPLRLICHALKKFDHYSLLILFGSAGEKQYPGQEVFTFFRVFSQAQGDASNVSDEDVQELEKSLEQAQNSGDIETSQLIMEFLKGYHESACDCESCRNEDDDSLEDLVNGLPDEMPAFIQQMLILMLMQEVFERVDSPNAVDDAALEDHIYHILEEKGFPDDLDKSVLEKMIETVIQGLREVEPYRKPTSSKPSFRGRSRKK